MPLINVLASFFDTKSDNYLYFYKKPLDKAYRFYYIY